MQRSWTRVRFARRCHTTLALRPARAAVPVRAAAAASPRPAAATIAAAESAASHTGLPLRATALLIVPASD